MGRILGPKNKLARRLGFDLELKTVGLKTHQRLLHRLNVPPGQHGQKGSRRKLSDYGQQLREKQKVRFTYSVTERQLSNYFNKAKRAKGATGEMLLSLLEARLDNVLYRLGLSPTRAMARQLINHGHVRVDKKKIDIPSFQVRKGMIIGLSEKALKIPALSNQLTDKKPSLPPWLKRQGPLGQVKDLPKREEIPLAVDEQLIVEYYSR